MDHTNKLKCPPGCDARVLLAIPVYNEQQHVNAVLDAVSSYIPDVVVIDDGSTDDTPILLARRHDVCIIAHPNNHGYGRSIIDALHFGLGCDFDWVITMDCDLQHEPASIPSFLAAIAEDNADVISGSRYLDHSGQSDCPPVDRRGINRTITEMLNRDLKLSLTDAFCGFKAYRLSAMERLQLNESGYGFPMEFWVEAARNCLRVREIPISLIYNDPNRHFGGELDNAQVRLQYYLHVYERTLEQAGWRFGQQRAPNATVNE